LSSPEMRRRIELGMTRGFVGSSETVDFNNPGKKIEVRNMNGRLLEKGDDGLWHPISSQHRFEYFQRRFAREEA